MGDCAGARFSFTADPAASPARFYLPELDVLRFFAFLAVFLQHAFQKTPAFHFPDTHQDLYGRMVAILAWSGGYGVDLFFVLSAFLITRLLMREKEVTGTLDVRRFYLRRILRIWPLYFAYLATVAIAGIFVTQFYLATRWLVLFVLLSGNFANALWGWTPTFITSHLWSISLEEQFYLVWPLVVRRRPARFLIRAAFAMLAVSIGARTVCWLVGAPGSLVWTNTLTRLDPLAAGILLATWTIGREHRLGPAIRMLMLAAGVGTILIVSAWCDPYWSPNSALTLFLGYPAVAFGCFMIVVAFLGMNIDSSNPAWRGFVYLGKISYGLYIWHLLALEMVIGALARPLPLAPEWIDSSIVVAVAALGLTIAISAASYRVLEAPFLRLKSRFELIPSRPT